MLRRGPEQAGSSGETGQQQAAEALLLAVSRYGAGISGDPDRRRS